MIKIHDEKWFREHCCRSTVSPCEFGPLIPKDESWKKLDSENPVMYWLSDGFMNNLVGQELEVTLTDLKGEGSKVIQGSRYFAGGYWIPNWAIEWVMEV
jgi:hypothetical protein